MGVRDPCPLMRNSRNYCAMRAMGMNLVAPVQQVNLILTLVLAIWILGEQLTVLRLLGVGLILLGPSFTLREEEENGNKPEPRSSASAQPAPEREAVVATDGSPAGDAAGGAHREAVRSRRRAANGGHHGGDRRWRCVRGQNRLPAPRQERLLTAIETMETRKAGRRNMPETLCHDSVIRRRRRSGQLYRQHHRRGRLVLLPRVCGEWPVCLQRRCRVHRHSRRCATESDPNPNSNACSDAHSSSNQSRRSAEWPVRFDGRRGQWGGAASIHRQFQQ